MRRLLLLAALVMVATLAFASVAQAQYTLEGTDDEDCSDVAEQLSPAGALFVPDVNGCIVITGVELEPTLDILNRPAYDPDTSEELGLVKDLDPDLSSGANRVTYQDFCEAFPTTPEAASPLAGLTAQEYYNQFANAKEQAILDPNVDGLACTTEDTAFLTGDTTVPTEPTEPTVPTEPTEPPEPTEPTEPTVPIEPAELTEPIETPEGKDTGDGDDGMTVLPDTGGAALLLPVAGLLLASGILGFAVVRRRT